MITKKGDKMKALLKEIIKRIEKINKQRTENSLCVIANDESNEEILNILKDYFLEDYESGIDIDSVEFLESKFGSDYQLIRDAESE
jgi:hypothetical protein